MDASPFINAKPISSEAKRLIVKAVIEIQNMRLKNNGFPPGGILFQDPRITAMKWTDAHTGVTERAQEVIRFRRNNPQIYDPAKDAAALDAQAVAIEIINYNCQRIGNDPHWCYDEAKSQINIPAQTAAPDTRNCPVCGFQLVPRYCKTCGGNKVNSWDCPVCKKSY